MASLMNSGSILLATLFFQPVAVWAAGGSTESIENPGFSTSLVLAEGLPEASQLKPGQLKRGANGKLKLAPNSELPAAKQPDGNNRLEKTQASGSKVIPPPATKRLVAGKCSTPDQWTRSISPGKKKPGRPYRLGKVNIKKRVIWGSGVVTPHGTGLSFGGQDQGARDGRPHTCLLEDGYWRSIHDELIKNNPLQPFAGKLFSLAKQQKRVAARTRYIYFQDFPQPERSRRISNDIIPHQSEIIRQVEDIVVGIRQKMNALSTYDSKRAEKSLLLLQILNTGKLANQNPSPTELARSAKLRAKAEVLLTRSAELLDAEPPARAMSQIAYEPKTGLYVLFGGDHFDYLTNDTWTFDAKKRKWFQLWPSVAPAPRANHSLSAATGGIVKLEGGYIYASNTTYMGGQYRDADAAIWTLNLKTGQWNGRGKGHPPGIRYYRRGIFHPDHFLSGPPPDRSATSRKLANLPVNRWVPMSPPVRPALNRDWGNAAIDLKRDMLLRWSGGHSAHGGTDVPHYHFATNRWELPLPIEFPLGQLYANTKYPRGVNFNLRPWITAHTYNNYSYSLQTGHMVFAGQPRLYHVYDPDTGDWISQGMKPKGMDYRRAFYSLTLFPAGKELFAWGHGLFRYQPEQQSWKNITIKGPAGLPRPSTDRASAVYDSKRNRLLFMRTAFKKRFGGHVLALDLDTFVSKGLNPKGRKGAGDIPFIARNLYDPEHDLVLAGSTLPPGADGIRRTPAYDAKNNKWIALRITGPNPAGSKGRGVSTGYVYDSKRHLYWAVDARGNISVLKLDPKRADPRPLR